MKDKEKKSYKERNGVTRVGSFLKTIGRSDILDKALNVVGEVASGDYIGAIQALISTDKDMSPEQLQMTNELIKLDYEDRKSARHLQEVALQQTDLFSKRFLYYLAIGVFLFSATIVMMLFFIEIPDENRDIVNFILGVVIGTGLTSIFNFFFGSSQGSKDKSDILNRS